MTQISSVKDILEQIAPEDTKMGDIKKLAKELKKNHDLSLELWKTGNVNARRLAIMIMDKNQIDEAFLAKIDQDLRSHTQQDQNRLMEWLMANQLMKNKKTIAIMESWINADSPLQRRTFWYHQARLRWTGQTPPKNTAELMDEIEENIAKEPEQVQWAMNFAAGWIGVYDKKFRDRCVKIGEKMGLYKDEIVPKNCTPNYLPDFIKIEAGKRNL